MQYRLRDQLSACVIGEHAIFLDVEADRYFRLPDALERAFLAYAASPIEAPPSALIEHGILVATAQEGNPGQERVELPLRSALEMPDHASGCGVAAIAEVLAALWRCRRALRTQPFARILAQACGDRNRRCPARLADPASEPALLYAVRLFHRARPYIPITPCCLPDSLALTRFLARRGLHSRIVIGVVGEPFSAHCWVQAGDLALNETVGHASAHTVIRVL